MSVLLLWLPSLVMAVTCNSLEGRRHLATEVPPCRGALGRSVVRRVEDPITVSMCPCTELNNWSLMSNERPGLLLCAEPGLVSGGVDVRLVSSCIAVVGGWPAKEVSPCAITVEARE